MNILTWNIRQGGSNSKFHSIITRLLEQNADVIVITEFWDGAKGNHIKQRLLEGGYFFQATHRAPFNVNCVFVASRVKFMDITDMNEYAVPYERWVQLYFPSRDLHMLGVHSPNHYSNIHDKEVFWQDLHAYATKHIDKNCIIIGDYNTDIVDDGYGGSALSCKEYLMTLSELGWIDSGHYTNTNPQQYVWNNRVGTFLRFDHAYVSPCLKEKLLNCYFFYQERIAKAIDHSALIVELHSDI